MGSIYMLNLKIRNLSVCWTSKPNKLWLSVSPNKPNSLKVGRHTQLLPNHGRCEISYLVSQSTLNAYMKFSNTWFFLFFFFQGTLHICTTISCKRYKEKRYKVLFLRILSAELMLSWLTLFLLCQLFVTSIVLVAWCSHCTKYPECWSSKTQQHIEYKNKWNQKDLG